MTSLCCQIYLPPLGHVRATCQPYPGRICKTVRRLLGTRRPEPAPTPSRRPTGRWLLLGWGELGGGGVLGGGGQRERQGYHILPPPGATGQAGG